MELKKRVKEYIISQLKAGSKPTEAKARILTVCHFKDESAKTLVELSCEAIKELTT